MRDLRSSLPCMLYRTGLVLHPLTLTVGDYVLTDQLVVERKSLPDLHQSMASGRLYNQVDVRHGCFQRALCYVPENTVLQSKHISVIGRSNDQALQASGLADRIRSREALSAAPRYVGQNFVF